MLFFVLDLTVVGITEQNQWLRQEFLFQRVKLRLIRFELELWQFKFLCLSSGRGVRLICHNNKNIYISESIIKNQMLTPQIARGILHRVNLQINSNAIFIKPVKQFDLLSRIQLYRDTRKSLKELYKSYPSQKLSKSTVLSSFAMLYTRFRSAYTEQDQPMLHRYLTNALYQEWKDNKKEAFKVLPTVYDIKIKQAQVHENENGKWIQCLIKLKHNDNIVKEHIVERKLGLMPYCVRNWYFVQFNN